jgi:phenylpropionate dioxygenase-like ring-hydroxylating dioxygenase large terminal subunit
MPPTRSRQAARGVPAGLECGLRNYWYPVAATADLTDQPLAVRCLDEDLVVWRGRDGAAHVLADYCPHRGARLSIGSVVGDTLQCIFHGLRFDGQGRCAFMPWEADDSPALRKISALAYPTEERRGLIFAYLGDPARLPAPALRQEVPGELWDDTCVGYVQTEVWDCNWLLAIDGMDIYHLPILHARSATQQAVDAAASSSAATAPPAERRMVVAGGRRGLSAAVVDASGQSFVSGMDADPAFLDEGFHLPALNCLSIEARAGTVPYHIFFWTVPIDADHTRVVRYVSRRATTPAERAEWERFYHDTALPRIRQVSAEDAMVAVSQRSLAFARSHERLLGPDREVARRRRLLRDAFLAQRDGRRHPPRP